MRRGQRSDGASVVLKAAIVDGRETEALLRHERDILMRLAGAGVIRPLGFETFDGRDVLVLEDAGPQNLAELVGGRKLDVSRFLDLAIDMAGGLQQVHDGGVIHRAICPENFVVDGGATLVDFNRATTVPSFEQAAGTLGDADGALAYIAPEQTGRTRRLVDYRADLYALGAVFFEMLTGAPPFRSNDPLELVHAHVARLPHPPSLIDPTIPAQLSNIVIKLLAKMPEWRYQSAAALKADLEEARRQWSSRAAIESFELGRADVPHGIFRMRELYGREGELRVLEQALSRLANGNAEMLLITGGEGIGKTSLVNALRESMGGRFRWLCQKSDLLRGSLPYAAMVEAFEQLIHELAREPPEVSRALRERVRDVLGSSAAALIEVLPDLELLVGPQPAPPRVSAREADNRLELAFGAFVQALAARDQPLILFLDDLQWADRASLRLIRSIMTTPDLRSFLLIGAYRSEAVDRAHPLTRAVDAVRDAGLRVRRLEISPLAESDVLALLCDGLNVPAAAAERLAGIVQRKTAGNPFFVRRFLAFLHRTGALSYDARSGRWSWDLHAAESAEVSDNVAQLLSSALRMLPEQAQRALETASCIGNRFALPLLAEIRGEPADDVARALWAPLHEGLIMPASEDPRFATLKPVELRTAGVPTYRFSHDRIQQAAYELVEDPRREHLRIGETLLARARENSLEHALGAIVDQLDRGSELVAGDDRVRLAVLNERAAKLARSHGAFDAALAYSTAGLGLLPDDAWRDQHHDVWFSLLRSASECAAYAGDDRACEEWVERGLQRTDVLWERAELYGVLIQSLATRDRYLEALRRGREAARELELELPDPPSAQLLESEKARVRQTLHACLETELLEAQPTGDPLARVRIELLLNMAPAAWFVDEPLFKLLSYAAVMRTVRDGLVPASSAAFSFYAVTLAIDGDYQEAYRYGELGLRLAERRGEPTQECRSLVVLGALVAPWCRPLRESLPLFRRAYACGLESGEVQFAGFALAGLVSALFSCGVDLDEVIAQAEAAQAFERRLGHPDPPYVGVFGGAARVLKGVTPVGVGDADAQELGAEEATNDLSRWAFHLIRMQTAYLMRDFGAAGRHADRAEELLPAARAYFLQVDHAFYSALLAAARLADADAEGRAQLAGELRQRLERLERWTVSAGSSNQHKRDLVAAELAAVEERRDEALVLYQRAIELAAQTQVTPELALAHERYARFAQANGQDHLAVLHLREAIDGYTRWGALAKVRALRAEFPMAASRSGAPALGEGVHALDRETLLKAAESLSSELRLQPLLAQLTQICIQAVSAERVVLAMDERGLVVRARANALGDTSLESTPLAAAAALPTSIFEHALRTGELVVVADASRDWRFKGDEDVASRGVRSVLAVPIVRAERTLAVLYCENNLASDAFSADRVEVLRLLSGQIAVALENSLLFDERSRAEASLRLLFDASARLGETIDYPTCAAKVGALIVPALADWCIVDLIEDGRMRPAVWAHVEPEKTRLVAALHRRYPVDVESGQPQAVVQRTGRPLLLAKAAEKDIQTSARDAEHLYAVRALEPRSVMAVPLVATGRILGSALLVRSRGVYDSDDLAVAAELMRSIARALDNARLHDELNEALQQRIQRERHLSMTFRQLPGSLVWTTDRDLSITYVSGGLVSGPQPAPGMSLYDVLGTTDATDPSIAHHLAALAGERQSFQYRLSDRWYEVLIEPLRDEQGAPVGCVAAAVDVTERRAEQERTARDQAWLVDAQRVAHVGSFEWRTSENVVTWSDELYRIYGVDSHDLDQTYEGFLARVHPDDRDSTNRVVLEAVRSRKPFTYDHRILRPDGSTRMLHTRGDVITNERNEVIGVLGSCLDITEMADAMRALERTRSLLQATIDATADGLLVVDRQGKVTAYNERFLSLWRIPSELAARGDDDQLLEYVLDQLEDRDEFLRSVRELYAQADRESFDVLRFKDGRVFERYSIPQRIGESVVGRVWSFRDVTDRQRLLRRALFLADAARLLGSLDVEPALDSVAHLAIPYLGTTCAVDLLADSEPRRLAVVSREPTSTIHPALHPAAIAGHATIFSLGARSCMTVPLVAKKAVIGAFTFVAAPMCKYTSQDLEVAEMLARRAALAVENARLYRESQEALKRRDEFLSIAAHEIRGPITALHLAVQGLQKGRVSEAAMAKVLGIIEREDRRLARFVDELLDVGRIRTSRMHFAFEAVDLADVVREASARLSHELTKSGSTLSITSEAQPIGQWDRFRLDQVVTNLLSNAIKFGAGKPITVTVGEREATATLVVKDRGIGIPPEMVDDIFRPFERAVPSRHYGGLGLGLFIVRTIVEGLGGGVRVESSPGLGSTFIVELPEARP